MSNFVAYANEQLKNINFLEKAYEVNIERCSKDLDVDDIIYDLSNYEFVYGQKNPQALMVVKDIFIKKSDVNIIGKNKDTLKFEKNGVIYIKFHAKDIIPLFEQYEEMRINIVGKPNVNEWNSRKIPQIFIEDLEVFDSSLDF